MHKGNEADKLGGSRCGDLTAADACKAMHPPKQKKKISVQFVDK